MEYLGVEIRTDGWGFFCSKTEGVYFGIDNLKSDIRKLVLPTYQPTKTLKWLEEQTGVEWVYSNEYNMLSAKGFMEGEVYDFKDNTAFLWLDGNIIISPYNEDGTWAKMTPREFIEKIAKGEVV